MAINARYWLRYVIIFYVYLAVEEGLSCGVQEFAKEEEEHPPGYWCGGSDVHIDLAICVADIRRNPVTSLCTKSRFNSLKCAVGIFVIKEMYLNH